MVQWYKDVGRTTFPSNVFDEESVDVESTGNCQNLLVSNAVTCPPNYLTKFKPTVRHAQSHAGDSNTAAAGEPQARMGCVRT